MKTITIFAYIILMIVFFGTGVMIFRHSAKYSYLSPRFKTITAVFSGIALIVFIISLFFVIRLIAGMPSGGYTPSAPASSSDINF